MSVQANIAVHSHRLNRDSQGQALLFQQALDRGRRGHLWAGLTGRAHELLSLADVPRSCAADIQNCDGAHAVVIALICGSESRSTDFDRDFNPLQDRTRDRWLGIAAARQRGRCLPPVTLIQIGDRYFVRDGHHRISVAKALGQKAIEATVEVWQVDWPLPWQGRSKARKWLGHRLFPAGALRPADAAGASVAGG